MLVSTESKLEMIRKATKRDQRPLRSKDAIGIRLGRVFARSKMGKHFRYTITDDSFEFERNNENIERVKRPLTASISSELALPKRPSPARAIFFFKKQAFQG